MKLWSSVRQQANKLAFEADRALRIRKEESAVDEARKQISAVQANIGQVALSLFRAGSLDVPQIASLAQQIDEIEAAIAQHQAAIEGIRAELAPAGEAEAAPASAQPQAPIEPVAPIVEQRAAPVETATGAPVPPTEEVAIRKCANCGAEVPGNAVFCPECGTRQS